jgi:uncharacterized protein (DUF1697 family)
MHAFVALLRGINVGGKNILPMREFRELLAGLGCEDVASYIQSGNAVFNSSGRASELSTSIADRIQTQYRFRPVVLVLAASDFSRIVEETPFVVAPGEENRLHIWFPQKPVSLTNTTRLAALASASERFAQTRAAFYLYAPDGIGRSKLAADVGRCLGVPATARNYRTASKILGLLSALRRSK